MSHKESPSAQSGTGAVNRNQRGTIKPLRERPSGGTFVLVRARRGSRLPVCLNPAPRSACARPGLRPWNRKTRPLRGFCSAGQGQGARAVSGPERPQAWIRCGRAVDPSCASGPSLGALAGEAPPKKVQAPHRGKPAGRRRRSWRSPPVARRSFDALRVMQACAVRPLASASMESCREDVAWTGSMNSTRS